MRKRVLGIFLIGLFIILTGCNDEPQFDELPPPQQNEATSRFETVPVQNSGLDNLVHYYFCEDYNYYLFLLGHVNNTPIAYGMTLIHDGKFDHTIGFERSSATEEYFSESVKNVQRNTVTNTNTFNWNVSAEAGVKYGPFKASVKSSVGGGTTKIDVSDRSVEDTFETATRMINSNSEHIGTSVKMAHPPGFYRYAFFSVTDVFYILVTNRERTQVMDAYTIFSMRDDARQGWGIDYEPFGGDFGKTAGGNLLEIPVVNLSDLPVPPPVPPTEYFIDIGRSHINGGNVNTTFIKTIIGQPHTINATPANNEWEFVRWERLSGGTVTFGNANSANTNVTLTSPQSSAIRAVFRPLTGPFSRTFSVGQIQGGGVNIRHGSDNSTNTIPGGHTSWELRTVLRLEDRQADGTFRTLAADFTYTVEEQQGDRTTIRIEATRRFALDRKVVRLEGTTSETRSGVIPGINYAYNNVRPFNFGIIRELSVRIDGGLQDDRPHIGFNIGNIFVEFTERF